MLALTRTAIRRSLPALFVFLLVLASSSSHRLVFSDTSKDAAVSPRPYFYDPSFSPDRSEIVFISGGDVWSVPSSGGEARLLVSNPATETRPLFSPDGRQLAFVSTRTGNGDIYVLSFATGDLRRLTFDDSFDQLDAWSRDGKWLYFSSTSRDIAGMNDIFRVNAEGGTPMPVSGDRYANEYFAAPSPDGNSLAFTARGIVSSQWWRKGHSHIDESEVWLMREGATPVYEPLTNGGAKDLWPMWSADGRSLYYVSDRSGAQNIWMQPLGGEAKQVTRFKDGRVLWPAISYDGRAIVFEHDFGVWKLDTTTGHAVAVEIKLRGAPAGPSLEHVSLSSQFEELRLSPDGKKVAFTARGEVFAASAKDGGNAARVTFTPEKESQLVWAPDSKRLAYVSDREGNSHIFVYDFTVGAETQLTRGVSGDDTPAFSPDGKHLAFLRGGRELLVMTLETKQERVLAQGFLERPPLGSERPFAWSPDNRWIAFQSVGEKGFKNVNVVAVESGSVKPVSFLANAGSDTLSWSPDGKYLLFDTSQRTEAGQLARVDLVPRTPKFREDQFRDLFKEESPKTDGPQDKRAKSEVSRAEAAGQTAAPASPREEKKAIPPVEIVFEGIQRRLSRVPVGVDVNSQSVSPDGKWVLMNATVAGQQNLYVYSLDELAAEPAVAKQITSTPGFKNNEQFTPDGREVYFLQQGRINIVNAENRQVRPLSVTAEMDVDFSAVKMAAFEQAWTYTRDNFFDPHFNGVDWSAVRAAYAPLVAGSRTADEMRRLISLMVGELNASHSGISAPFGSAQPATGRLGLRFDRAEYERSGHLKISEVIQLSPASLAAKAKGGEYLVAVDGVGISARTNLDQMLDHKILRRVEITLASDADGTGKRTVAIQPVNAAAEKGLLYRQWVAERREYVAKISGGRLGYVHMPDMSANSLDQLYVDLDAENQNRAGVVIDIRNNNGGFVNAYALDVFTRRPYLTMTVRGLPPAPARPVLGQRALERPTILVINQHSLSDAEDFTEGYRALKLGKVVGEPTAGWIIYTSNVSLIDGSSYRLPFIKVTGSQGDPMEMRPRPVDVLVKRPIGESYGDHDIQLQTAVRVLLKDIGETR